MNATLMPTPISGPTAAPAQNSTRARAGDAGEANQFKQHLDREVDQRQGAATAPAASSGPAKSAAKQQPQNLDKQAAAARSNGQSAPPAASATANGKAAADAGDSVNIADAGDASEEVSTLPTNPMVDLINLVASFNQPVAPVALAARPAVAGGADAAGVDRAAQGFEGALPGTARSAQPGLLAPGLAGDTDASQAQAAGAAIGAMLARADGASDAIDNRPADSGKTLQRWQSGDALPAAASAGQAKGERGVLVPGERAAVSTAARLPDALPHNIGARLVAERAASPFPDRPAAPRGERALLPQVDGTTEPRTERVLAANVVTGQAGAPLSAAQVSASAELQAARTDSAALLARASALASDAVAVTMADSGPAAPLAGSLQQGALGATNPAIGLADAEKIAARVGTPGWDNQVAQKVVWMVAGEEHSATMTLNPPDMGPMQIVLSVTNDQASVTFSSATPEVRQALEDALPKLREMMNANGVSLGEATVNDGRAEQRQAQESGQRQRNGNEHGTGNGRGRDADVPPEPARPPRRGGAEGLVDTFA